MLLSSVSSTTMTTSSSRTLRHQSSSLSSSHVQDNNSSSHGGIDTSNIMTTTTTTTFDSMHDSGSFTSRGNYINSYDTKCRGTVNNKNGNNRSIAGAPSGEALATSATFVTTLSALEATQVLLQTALPLCRDGKTALHVTDNHNQLALANAILQRASQLDALLLQQHKQATTNKSSTSSTKTNTAGSSAVGTLNAASLQRQFLLARDGESNYTPLHYAVYKANVTALLLLLRHAAAATGQDDKKRFTHRPMALLHGDVSNNNNNSTTNTSLSDTTSLLSSLVNALDGEQMKPCDLLVSMQRNELLQCRLSLPRNRISLDYNSNSTNNNIPRRRRRSSFDVNDDDDDDDDEEHDEQNEFDLLHRHVRHLQRQFRAHSSLSLSSNNVHHGNYIDATTTTRAQSSYRCEVFTFGSAHHCALGAASQETTTMGTTASQQQKFRPHRVQAFAQSNSGNNSDDTNSSDGDTWSGGAVAVAGATYHTLVVTQAGHLYVFGLGKGGRLGTGDDDKTHYCPLPTRIRGALATRRVVAVAAAENHSLAVTAQGDVFSWGSNRFGQLGVIPNATATTSTQQQQQQQSFKGKVGKVLATNTSGTCCSSPRRVDDLKNVHCVSVAAGAKHSVALSKYGEVYVWGDNTAGQLGTNRRSGLHKVQRMEALWNSGSSNYNYNSNKNSYGNDASSRKVTIAIAASESATLVLTLPTGTGLNLNAVYSWGHGNHTPSRVHFEHPTSSLSSVGHNSSSNNNRPINPVAIACARYHNVAITADGLVYTWGFHEESLGTANNRKGNNNTNKSCSNSVASPQLVTGMLPENGGGIAVAVAASENHTAVVTDTGLLYTWGATHGPNILGHEGVRWQPNPKRVPGVYRAVGVAAAKEHTVLLIGTSFPPIPPAPPVQQSSSLSSLETMAARTVAAHVDLFNVFPILITAERTQCNFLIDYCREFIRRNLDGVLNVGQKSVMDCYLNEQLLGCRLLLESDRLPYDSRDEYHHPLLSDIILAGSQKRKTSWFHQGDHLVNPQDWIQACLELSRDPQVAGMIERRAALVDGEKSRSRSNSFFYHKSPRKLSSASSVGNDKPERSYSKNNSNGSGCSDRCWQLTTNMDMSTREQVDTQLTMISKEVRGLRKRLNQIAKLEEMIESTGSPLSEDQRNKLARRPQLEVDLRTYEPAIDKLQRRLEDFIPIDQIRNAVKAEALKHHVEEKKIDGTAKERELEVDQQKKCAVVQNTSMAIKLRCDLCSITCPDETSYAMHLSGRKHRNRVAQAEEEDAKSTAASIQLEQEKREQADSNSNKPLEVRTVSIDASTRAVAGAKAASPWKVDSSPTQPKYKLPPPPHPVPDKLAEPDCPQPKTLREIMDEQARASKPAKKKVSKSLAKPSASLPMPLQLPAGAAPAMKSPPWMNAPIVSTQVSSSSSSSSSSSMLPLQPPPGSSPPLKSPPWASAPSVATPPTATSFLAPANAAPAGTKKSGKATPTTTARAVASPATPSPAKNNSKVETTCQSATGTAGSFSLADFMAANSKAPTPVKSATTPRPVAWNQKQQQQQQQQSTPTQVSTGPTTMAAQGITATAPPCSVSPPSLSFKDIQQQERDWKSKADHACIADGGKWFIERRERAGSFKEIQSAAAKEREERLLVEEQLWIEKQIAEELAAKKKKEEDDAAARDKKRAGRKKNRNKPRSSSAGAATNQQELPHGKNNKGRDKRTTPAGKTLPTTEPNANQQ